MEYITESAAHTKNLGKKIADSLIRGKETRNIIALTGDLGSGKTTFTQGFCKALGIYDRIISPTFILIRKYEIPKDVKDFRSLYHVDLYRLEGKIEPELEGIGLTDFWKDKDSIVLIEWAEKITKLLPEKTIWVKFEYLTENSRKISLE
jgi:tRNA threonylcarbamoyladenosine biosynthesis protein TsaE